MRRWWSYFMNTEESKGLDSPKYCCTVAKVLDILQDDHHTTNPPRHAANETLSAARRHFLVSSCVTH